MQPVDEDVDHVRGPADARLIVEYGHRGGYDAIVLLEALAGEEAA